MRRLFLIHSATFFILLLSPGTTMATPQPRISIIGAGAAGLTTAYYLHKQGYTNFNVYEARSERVGGRLFVELGVRTGAMIHKIVALHN